MKAVILPSYYNPSYRIFWIYPIWSKKLQCGNTICFRNQHKPSEWHFSPFNLITRYVTQLSDCPVTCYWSDFLSLEPYLPPHLVMPLPGQSSNGGAKQCRVNAITPCIINLQSYHTLQLSRHLWFLLLALFIHNKYNDQNILQHGDGGDVIWPLRIVFFEQIVAAHLLQGPTKYQCFGRFSLFFRREQRFFCYHFRIKTEFALINVFLTCTIKTCTFFQDFFFSVSLIFIT